MSGENKVPLNPRTGQAASPTDPATWGSFEEACRAGYKHVGFVLSDQDPYCIIDLDDKPEKPLTDEQRALHKTLLDTFQSYTERSTSGRGYHIVIRGRAPSGVHSRDSVEMYSSARYMICTGNVVRQAPIVDYQEGVDYLYGKMKPAASVELEDYDSVVDDRDLVDMAMNAVNGDKFTDLCNGKWQEMGYPSQSEADYALLAILAFYTRDNEQVRRVFRMSELGKRDKATRNNVYLDRCLQKIRAVQPAPVDFSALKAEVDKLFGPPSLTGGSNQGVPNPPPPPQNPPINQMARLKTGDSGVGTVPNITLPPGLIGDIALYFYQSAVRPVPEIALSAALAVTAGVCGRSYNISGTGLNQYLIVLAKTGSGKEGMAQAVDRLVAAVRPMVPMVDQFVGPSAFASGQALIRVLDEKPAFVSVLGEFGITLQQLCSSEANAAQLMLKKVLLDLYTKSGWSSVLRESAYADKEKTTKVVQAPAVTILAESVPEAFFDGLDISHISDGLIPRFSIVEYTGIRVDRNPNAGQPPNEELVKRFAELVAIALTTSNNGTVCPVQIEPQAQILLDAFDKEADAKINGAGGSDVEMQLWNRAHLKALKLSALLAVGVNPHQPIISVNLAHWAMDFVRKDVNAVSTRFQTGDVGRGASKMENDLRRVVAAYFTSGFAKMKSYGVEEGMYRDRVIPYAYLLRRTSNLSAFKNDKRGTVRALKETIEAMCESGSLAEVTPGQMRTAYKSSAKAYYILGSTWSGV